MLGLDFSFLFQPAVGTETYFDWILEGLKWTVITSSLSWCLALFCGTIVGILRTLPNRLLNFIGAAYVESLRNVPIIVQLFFWFYVWPELLPKELGKWIKDLDPHVQILTAGILCLGLFTSARIAEQVRSGIQSLAGGQRNAALAMGFTLPQAYRYIIMPQAFRIVIPPLTSELLNIFKNSAVLQTIGLMELSRQAAQINDYTAKAYESFIVITVIFVIINVLLMWGMRFIEVRTRIPGLISGGH
ncbi:MAG: amino acid ABC transporter permease [Wohlfahrtiimonas sp.]